MTHVLLSPFITAVWIPVVLVIINIIWGTLKMFYDDYVGMCSLTVVLLRMLGGCSTRTVHRRSRTSASVTWRCRRARMLLSRHYIAAWLR